ncbi:MAG: DUF4266 domain-containing protein [Nitrosomonas sp.]|nr:DUF4266 domain-containing protein [Nitrosomonas sp.]MCP5251570.1 DUF4266 domain-containing protein [Burkholderiales bacterium]
MRSLYIGLFCMFLSACSLNVKPWERGNLAKPHMQLDPDPSLSLIRNEIFRAKEASSGSSGGGGGGCGCN